MDWVFSGMYYISIGRSKRSRFVLYLHFRSLKLLEFLASPLRKLSLCSLDGNSIQYRLFDRVMDKRKHPARERPTQSVATSFHFIHTACKHLTVLLQRQAAAVSARAIFGLAASEVVTVTQQRTNSRQTHYFYISSLWVASIIQNTSIQLPLLQTQYSPCVVSQPPLLTRFGICCKFVLNWSYPIHWTFCRPPPTASNWSRWLARWSGLIVMYQGNLLTPLDPPFRWLDWFDASLPATDVDAPGYSPIGNCAELR